MNTYLRYLFQGLSGAEEHKEEIKQLEAQIGELCQFSNYLILFECWYEILRNIHEKVHLKKLDLEHHFSVFWSSFP